MDGDKGIHHQAVKIRAEWNPLGMICAEDEIGVGASHDGIIVITDREVKPGTPAAEYFGLESDYVLEVDLTPNRIDAASHLGVARDVAAWLSCHRTPGAKVIRPSVDAFRSDRPRRRHKRQHQRHRALPALQRSHHPRSQCGRKPQMAARSPDSHRTAADPTTSWTSPTTYSTDSASHSTASTWRKSTAEA